MTSIYKNLGNELNIGKLISKEMIQTLWSGYGELVRLKFESKSIIVKHVKLPTQPSHPKGWSTNTSHQRKIDSYDVEVYWYNTFSKEVDDYCYIPQALKCLKQKSEWIIVMEDLSSSGYAYTTQSATKNHLKSCLIWLANFHAKYMGKKDENIWKNGTYWHLNTRPDELEALGEGELRKYAKLIDTTLNNSKYQTIVHGDAKLANFCFNNDATKCAAVDFQYVGHGCGMKDVVSFMSSSVEPAELSKMEDWFVDFYFAKLKKSLKYYQPNINADQVEDEYRSMYNMAWADLYRFLKGWSPKHYKINAYSEGLTKKAIESLKMKV